jgi:DNA helicase HerA-like ATPase
MLTLLKQARSFGIGIILSTQNPVDIDYKGLANIGTWFIGRLQTKQDKENRKLSRVMSIPFHPDMKVIILMNSLQ